MAGSPPRTLTEADNGKTVKVKVGDLVAISLKGNPTTGYSWRTAKLDGKAIEQAGDPKYTTNPHRPGMVGVGGTFLFTFKAAKPGKTQVSLEYAPRLGEEQEAREDLRRDHRSRREVVSKRPCPNKTPKASSR